MSTWTRTPPAMRTVDALPTTRYISSARLCPSKSCATIIRTCTQGFKMVCGLLCPRQVAVGPPCWCEEDCDTTRSDIQSQAGGVPLLPLPASCLPNCHEHHRKTAFGNQVSSAQHSNLDHTRSNCLRTRSKRDRLWRNSSRRRP